MKTDGRLARMLHVLVHMGLLDGRETSERIALMLNTNPVVVRRTLGALRDHGIVESEGGRGGGWKLTRSLDQVTVLDVQRALTAGTILTTPVSRDHPSCPVERAANSVLEEAYAAAEKQLIAKYGVTTLAQIAEHAKARRWQRPRRETDSGHNDDGA
ncbi:RrF2 family transcriptional regulator [Rhodopseudomonas palustris]|nr:Rrf2 family transcriptional regulator [Rhodopseudomonas palustris]